MRERLVLSLWKAWVWLTVVPGFVSAVRPMIVPEPPLLMTLTPADIVPLGRAGMSV
jgi:hypothetical protein